MLSLLLAEAAQTELKMWPIVLILSLLGIVVMTIAIWICYRDD